MKTFKIILFILFLVLLTVFGIQNQEYFMTSTSLLIDFKVGPLAYKATPLPNWAYWVFCLALGLLIAGIRGRIVSFRLKRRIKEKEKQIKDLEDENRSLQTRLDIFLHDPYIKKHLEEKARKDQAQIETVEPVKPEKRWGIRRTKKEDTKVAVKEEKGAQLKVEQKEPVQAQSEPVQVAVKEVKKDVKEG